MRVQRIKVKNLTKYAHAEFIEYNIILNHNIDLIMQAQKLLKRIEERDLYSCTANIRIPEIKALVTADCPECKKHICLDGDIEVRRNLEIVKNLRGDENEKENFLKDVWQKFKGESQSLEDSELSLVKENLWLEVRLTLDTAWHMHSMHPGL